MSLTTYSWNDPTFSLADLPTLLDEFRDIAAPTHRRGPPTEANSQMARPRMDLSEDSKIVTAAFDLPGMTKDAVNVDIQYNRLIISGENKISQGMVDKGYTVRERSHGRFSRSLPLPPGIKPASVHAKMENGVLTITFPKMSDEQTSTHVRVD